MISRWEWAVGLCWMGWGESSGGRRDRDRRRILLAVELIETVAGDGCLVDVGRRGRSLWCLGERGLGQIERPGSFLEVADGVVTIVM